MTFNYRFDRWKDASWNSFDRQKERYELIRPFLGTRSVGAEIGVYKGGFGEFLIDHCRKLYLVDPWYRSGGFWNSGIPDDSRVETVIGLLRTYQAEIEAGKVEIMVEFAATFFATLGEEKLDFIYLDASHEYEKIRGELDLAWICLRPGGYLLGDDYDPEPDSRQNGVFLAVNEFAASVGQSLVLDASRQWGLRKPF